MVVKKKSLKFVAGKSTCLGCAIPIIVHTVLENIDYPVVVSNATGCLEVTSTIYPHTSWNIPYIHSAFANSAATISGIESAFRVMKNRKKIKEKEVKFLVFAGDGGTYDIGLQALSGAFERGHDFLYVCYDNGAYMNTGGQRSSATPLGASTQTSPAGKKTFGKEQQRKDLMAIAVAHGIPYAATASIGHLDDFKNKVKKAIEIKGPKLLLVFSPCINVWKFPMGKTIEVAKLAVETNFWPLYEVENGLTKINYFPKEKLPATDFLATQARFKHLFALKNKEEIFREIQAEIDFKWSKLKIGLC